MNELTPEIKSAIIISASHASIEFAKIKVDGKRGKKSFNQLYIEAFEKNYDKLVSIINKPETSAVN